MGLEFRILSSPLQHQSKPSAKQGPYFKPFEGRQGPAPGASGHVVASMMTRIMIPYSKLHLGCVGILYPKCRMNLGPQSSHKTPIQKIRQNRFCSEPPASLSSQGVFPGDYGTKIPVDACYGALLEPEDLENWRTAPVVQALLHTVNGLVAAPPKGDLQPRSRLLGSCSECYAGA